MILVDTREGSGRGVGDLEPHIRKLRVEVDKVPLAFGDACFDGNGPDGKITIGVERKTMRDMLSCIDDARYSAHQKVGMRDLYQVSILMIEGVWRPDSKTGYLMELISTLTWRPLKQGGFLTRYNKLFRYLLGVQLSGTVVLFTRDIEQTAFDIVECYQYFSKKWDQHTSLLETRKLALPELTGKPSLVLEWAARLPGIGVKHSMEATRIFKTGHEMGNADETDWLKIPGLSVNAAQRVVAEIWGTRNGDS